jgi:serine/threonine protein kinase
MSHAEPVSLSPDRGELLSHSRYEVVTKIASGGMATVYLGRARGAKGFTRVVAIKRAHPHLLESAAFRGMLLAEARLASHIHHPNVAGVIDVEEFEDELLLVMDYVEGLALSDLVRGTSRKGEKMPLPVTFRVVLDAAAGLHAAHTTSDEQGHPLGIVHRDVSPQNVLVGLDGVGRVVDFGIAKATLLTPTMTQIEGTTDGARKGKLGYMAPEYVSDSIVTPQADVFALGVILWELICGRRLFRAGDAIRTLRAVLRGPIPVPSSVNPEVGEAMDEVVLTALARNPKERYKTALEFAEALEAAARRDHDVASAARTGAWVQDFAHEVLEKRRMLFRETMSSIRTASPAESFAPPRSLLIRTAAAIADNADHASDASSAPPPDGAGAVHSSGHHRVRTPSLPDAGDMCHSGNMRSSCADDTDMNSSANITSLPVRGARWSTARMVQLAAVIAVFVVAGVGLHGELSRGANRDGFQLMAHAQAQAPVAAAPTATETPVMAPPTALPPGSPLVVAATIEPSAPRTETSEPRTMPTTRDARESHDTRPRTKERRSRSKALADGAEFTNRAPPNPYTRKAASAQ